MRAYHGNPAPCRNTDGRLRETPCRLSDGGPRPANRADKASGIHTHVEAASDRKFRYVQCSAIAVQMPVPMLADSLCAFPMHRADQDAQVSRSAQDLSLPFSVCSGCTAPCRRAADQSTKPPYDQGKDDEAF